jgi:phosphoribosyl 1,2-cyclic phosphodiesterase
MGITFVWNHFIHRRVALFVASLNSGSNGNCYYIGNDTEAVLIDGGLSCRETEKRMKRLNLDLKKVKGIFISHEHADHIMGVKFLSKKYNLPVYITPATLQSLKMEIPEQLVFSVRSNESIKFESITVTPFPKLHDAVDPHSFIVTGRDLNMNEIKVGVFTDIGVPCDQVITYFQQCNAVFLETNYDAEMLERGRYPLALKNRIRGGHGHLSNEQALTLFTEHRPVFMSHVFLSHLSQHNNTPQKAQLLFEAHAGDTKVILASRHRETSVYTIKYRDANVAKGFSVNTHRATQLNLFQ